MKDEFIIERQGKRFVLYAGLLNEAHERGLIGIDTELLQAPSAGNDQTAIVKATASFPEKAFSGIGDANPRNTSPTIAPHAIRMAETRAKARALRDAINVSMVALEELGDEDGAARFEQDFQSDGSRGSGAWNGDRGQRQGSGSGGGDIPATAAQVKAIYVIARNEAQLDESQLDGRCVEVYGKIPNALTKRQASELIDRLKAGNF